MKLKRLAHIGLGVKDLNEVAKVYAEFLSLVITSTDKIGELLTAHIPIGETNIELVQSTTPEGVINKFVKNKGEGVHHLAFEVDDIDAVFIELKSKGVSLTSDKPTLGAHGAKVLFLHPKITHGVLIELCQYPKKDD